MTFEEFRVYCNRYSCLRGVNTSKQCDKDSKRQKCYKKYIDKQEKNTIFKVDVEWIEVCEDVDRRDKYRCQIWNILTIEEKQFILDTYAEDFQMLNILDHAHIIPRSQDKSKLYDVNNIVLVRRYFHSLLDGYKHPITRENISKEERQLWLECARDKRKFR